MGRESAPLSVLRYRIRTPFNSAPPPPVPQFFVFICGFYVSPSGLVFREHRMCLLFLSTCHCVSHLALFRKRHRLPPTEQKLKRKVMLGTRSEIESSRFGREGEMRNSIAFLLLPFLRCSLSLSLSFAHSVACEKIAGSYTARRSPSSKPIHLRRCNGARD